MKLRIGEGEILGGLLVLAALALCGGLLVEICRAEPQQADPSEVSQATGPIVAPPEWSMTARGYTTVLADEEGNVYRIDPSAARVECRQEGTVWDCGIRVKVIPMAGGQGQTAALTFVDP